jgi:hypothetical protein
LTGKGNIIPAEIDYKRKVMVTILLVAKNKFVRLMYKTKTHANCTIPCSLQLPCSTLSTNVKNTDKIMKYIHSAGYLQSIMVNSKFSVVSGKNATFPKNMAGYLVRPLQAGLVLCDFFLCDIALMRLENLHHF